MSVKKAISKRKRNELILNFIKHNTVFYEDHKIANKKVYVLRIDAEIIEGALSNVFIDFLTKDK